MASWDSREIENLEMAIAKHRRDNPQEGECDLLLAAVQHAAEAVLDLVSVPEDALNQQRTQLCALCRGFTLYDCDVAKGWSKNCTFIFANTTEFGSL